MNLEHRAKKQAIRSFLQNHYTDERLTMLLAHAQSGRLEMYSCCCFIGTLTADHALRGKGTITSDHLQVARLLSGASEAETAFGLLCENGAKVGFYNHSEQSNAKRRRILIPIIRAEMRRRDTARKQIEWKQELVEMST